MSAGLTNAWSGIKTGYGIGAGASAGSALGTAGGLGSLAAFAGSPLGMLLISQAAMPLLGKLFGGKSATDKALEQQLGIGKSLIPQLQQQAAGMPTAVTRAQGNALNTQVTRAMQSQAASASRAMPSGHQFAQTTPARAAQGRLQGARIEGLANIMGMSQVSAQDQLAKLYQGGMEVQAKMEQANLQSREKVGNMLGQLFADMQNGGLDDTDRKIYNEIMAAIGEAVRNIDKPINIGNTGNTVR